MDFVLYPLDVQKCAVDFSSCKYDLFVPTWLGSPSGPRPHCSGLEVTLRHTTLGRTPLDKWSARCRYLYLRTHNTHKRQTSMPQAGLEPAIPSGPRPTP